MFKRKIKNLIKNYIIIFCCFFFLPESIKAQASEPKLLIEDKDGIFRITPLMNAVLNEDLQAVDFLSQSNNGGSINQKNIGGASALSIASRVGNLEIAKKLVESGANVNDSDNEGWTPLMRACLAKNSDLVKFLLQKGADPRKTNQMGETAIVQASYSGCKSCLEVMFDQYDFAKNFNSNLLKNQIVDSIKISNNKNDQETADFLKEILIKINKSDKVNKIDVSDIKSINLPKNKKTFYKLSPKANSTKNLKLLKEDKLQKSKTYRIIYKFLGKILQADGTKILYLEKYNNKINNKISEEMNNKPNGKTLFKITKEKE